VLAAPPTLRILRREPTSDTTTRIPTPPNDADNPPTERAERPSTPDTPPSGPDTGD